MAVGTYTYKLPICDLCELPWIPVGWKQDSDPRNLPEGTKPLRCGKCKNIRWDWKHVKQQKAEATETAVNPFDPTKTIEMPRNAALNEALDKTQASPKDTSWEMGGIDPRLLKQDSFMKDSLLYEDTKDIPRPRPEFVPRGTSRCKHRMTDCPICHPKEAA